MVEAALGRMMVGCKASPAIWLGGHEFKVQTITCNLLLVKSTLLAVFRPASLSRFLRSMRISSIEVQLLCRSHRDGTAMDRCPKLDRKVDLTTADHDPESQSQKQRLMEALDQPPHISGPPKA